MLLDDWRKQAQNLLLVNYQILFLRIPLFVVIATFQCDKIKQIDAKIANTEEEFRKVLNE